MSGPKYLAIILIFFLPLAASAGDGGRAVFEARGCSGCHATSKVEGRGAKAPTLWYAGSKFNKGFLEGWLSKPYPIRPLAYRDGGGHPALNTQDAAAVALYLEGLGADESAGEDIGPSGSREGKTLFITKFACYGCHQARSGSEIHGGLSAPSLVEAGARLRPGWIYSFMRRTTELNHGPFGMPDYSGLMSDSELRSISAYVASFGRGPKQ